MRSPLSPTRSRTRGRRTTTGPIPVMISHSGRMSVAHQPLLAIIRQLVGMAAEQGRNLGLDGLRQ
jgi:hypothetical protein